MRPDADPPATLLARLLTLPQYVIPQHLLTRWVRLVTHSTCKPWKNLLIRRFIALYGVDMSTALEPDFRAYPSFNAFFTRPLRPGARPLTEDPHTLACPIDGAVSRAGRIEGEAAAASEVSEVGWFAPDALPPLAFPHDYSIIARWAATAGADGIPVPPTSAFPPAPQPAENHAHHHHHHH